MSERDYRAIGRLYLKPERPQLQAAREAVVGCYHPREAWEALAARELIPMAWTDDATRRFRADVTRLVAGNTHTQTMEFDYPSPTELAVLLAADPQGVARAEALLREVKQRLAPWLDTAELPGVVWRMHAPQRDQAPVIRDFKLEGYGPPSLLYPVWYALSSPDRIVRDPEAVEAARAFINQREANNELIQAAWLAGAQVLWRKAARERRRVDPTSTPMFIKPMTQRFDELPDPFEPYLSLIETGYMTHGAEWLPDVDAYHTSASVMRVPQDLSALKTPTQ